MIYATNAEPGCQGGDAEEEDSAEKAIYCICSNSNPLGCSKYAGKTPFANCNFLESLYQASRVAVTANWILI